ncbi:MAG: Wzz/FepE/Etk N-terminal domain-containing protein [Acidithiobacillus sp.]
MNNQQIQAQPDSSDEISLYEIYNILKTKRYFILSATILCAFVAGTYILLKPENYTYQACVTMGIIGRDTRGEPIFIDSPRSSIAQLNNAYIPSLIDQFDGSQKKIKFAVVDFKAFHPKDSSMVCIKTKATRRLGDSVSHIQDASLQRLVSDNSRMSAIPTASAEANLGSLQETTKILSEKIPYIKYSAEENIKQLNQNAQSLSAQLQSIADQKSYINNQLQLIKTKNSVLKNQQKLISKETREAIPLVKEDTSSVDNTPSALTAIMQNNQVTQEQQQLFNIQIVRSVDIPKEQIQLINQLKSLGRKVVIVNDKIATNTAKIIAYKANEKRQINNIKDQIAINSGNILLAKASLGGVQITHIVRQSSPSIEPVGPGKAIFIVLGALVGLMLSVLYALLANAATQKTNDVKTKV